MSIAASEQRHNLSDLGTENTPAEDIAMLCQHSWLTGTLFLRLTLSFLLRRCGFEACPCCRVAIAFGRQEARTDPAC